MLKLELLSLTRFARSVLVAAMATSPSWASVLIVDSVAGPFTQIQGAVVAANAGDTILVRAGTYGPVTITAKPLTISADAGALVTISGTTTVEGIASDQVLVLSGLRLVGLTTQTGSPTAGIALHVRDSGGFVRVQGCEIRGARGWGDGYGQGLDCCNIPFHSPGWNAALVENCTAAAFTACTFQGGRGAYAFALCICGAGGVGGAGLRLSSSIVSLQDSHATGGAGGANAETGGYGGNGVEVLTGSGLVASNTVCIGGTGGGGFDIFGVGGGGGNGLLIAFSALQHIGCTFIGGAPGYSYFPGSSKPTGPPGSPIAGTGSVFEFTVPSAKLVMPSIAREGTSLALTAHGVPGALAALRIVRVPTFVPIPSQRGVVLVRQAFPPLTMLLGTLPASGVLSTSIPLTQLPSGVDSGTYYFQLAVHDATSGVTLGSSYALLLLDSTF